jgi:hypothetical protein
MTFRESIISKLNKLSDAQVQEVSDFIDFVVYKHQQEILKTKPVDIFMQKWLRWLESIENLEIVLSEPARNYPEILLSKYRQQGLNL